VEADEGQLSQVSQNLVINASQAMPDGGTITIKAANKILAADEYSALPPGNYIELLFQDTGIGIAQEHITRIFEPYFSSKSTGSGLGLAICYSIIKNHNGLITVNSEPGKGSIFSILLPATIEPVRKLKKQEVLQKTAAKKILVMDDDKTVQEILRAMLTFIGCSVELACDGKEALALYMQAKTEEAPFDLVIMDLTIPGGMGGKETMAALLALDPTANAVVSSGYANDHIMANYQQYGFCGILTKPFKINELNKVIAAILPATD
jgi:CheY-like chemotaxis protein